MQQFHLGYKQFHIRRKTAQFIQRFTRGRKGSKLPSEQTILQQLGDRFNWPFPRGADIRQFFAKQINLLVCIRVLN
ncbi:hypothetical protein OC00_08220 [Xanthomonas vasicola]|nr:hypothetical protein NX08_012740 [Xanthomonas vasicola]KGR53804.1 hypothetical protein NX07_06515 [Xanthomonas vasicola]KGR57676.1 hypothetical protein NX09_03330 [Xanthomonas vasicola]KGT84470.1 hypothetical protein OC00_08220 [Xanthomonas vasicola]